MPETEPHMKKLKETYSRNGYTYNMARRNDHAVMYMMMDGDRFVGFEVGRIKSRKNESVMPDGRVMEAGELHWSDEDFGVIAWWCKDLDRAEGYYRQMSTPPETRSGVLGEESITPS